MGVAGEGGGGRFGAMQTDDISDHRKMCACYHEIRCASFFNEEN